MRLDNYVAAAENCSRSRAAQMIKMGRIAVDGKTADKPSLDVSDKNFVEISKSFEYASSGGFKLEKALSDFGESVSGCVCVDIGASNGGFTDCLLQGGAAKVYAADVAECALPEYLKNDTRVEIKERLNAREIQACDIGEPADVITVDVSFISLTLVLPRFGALLKDDGRIFALIKPQFEIGKSIGKSGIVRSVADRASAVNKISDCAKSVGLFAKALTAAPIREGKNVEYVILLTKSRFDYKINRITIETLREIENR